jgi:radical SAM family uncharacterized protein
LISPYEIELKLDRILPSVQKPGRYVGGELNQVVKNWDTTPIRMALAFPDIYDLGLPNLGLAILYETLNARADVLAERVYSPWEDMEKLLRQEQIPLFSLETHHPIIDFDILGFTLPYESLYTNALNLLDLSGIPLLSAERTEQHPLVIAGGHAAFNPEPMADFIDAFVVGEGEEVIHEVVNTVQRCREKNISRAGLLLELSKIWGVYVPSLYQINYLPEGQISSVQPISAEVPAKVTRRFLPRLPYPPTKFIVPNIDVVHNRVSVEIMRGCTRGCRFCHAGIVTRPVRERPVEMILQALDEALQATGYEEIALLSLSSSDYSHILDLVTQLSQKYADRHLTISLPSLRIESLSVDILEQLKGSRQGGFTLAPEAATDKMRSVINKPISEEQLLETVRAIYSRGWQTIKLYFMIGHPTETLEDVQAIVDLCQAVIREGRKIIGKRASLHAGVSTFVPKPHTPFQWVSCDTLEQIKAKQDLLRQKLRSPGIKINWTDPRETMFEAWLSRGDRRMGQVIKSAWQHGALFDAWQDHFNPEAWQHAFQECGLDPAFYTHRVREINEILPWDHISPGVSKKYLVQEYQRSLDGILQPDCREQCYSCGILPTFNLLRSQYPDPEWKCPPVKRKAKKTELVPDGGVL